MPINMDAEPTKQPTPNNSGYGFGEEGKEELRELALANTRGKITEGKEELQELGLTETQGEDDFDGMGAVDFDGMLGKFIGSKPGSIERTQVADRICRIVQPDLIKSKDYPDAPVRSDIAKDFLAQIYALGTREDMINLSKQIFYNPAGGDQGLTNDEVLCLTKIINDKMPPSR